MNNVVNDIEITTAGEHPVIKHETKINEVETNTKDNHNLEPGEDSQQICNEDYINNSYNNSSNFKLRYGPNKIKKINPKANDITITDFTIPKNYRVKTINRRYTIFSMTILNKNENYERTYNSENEDSTCSMVKIDVTTNPNDVYKSDTSVSSPQHSVTSGPMCKNKSDNSILPDCFSPDQLIVSNFFF